MSKTYLSNVDLAWLRMDDPNNLMVITGFMIFGTPLDRKRLAAVTSHSLLKFERFHQRVILPRSPFQRPYWEEDPFFDLDYHIQTTRFLPSSEPLQVQLADFISHLMSIPLDYKRPLWKFYLIEKFGEGSVLVARLHHAMADGIALMHVLLSMASEDPRAPIPRLRRAKSAVPASRDDGAESETRLFSSVERAAELAAHLTGQVSGEALHILTDLSYARKQAQLGAKAALAFGKLALRLPDPPTVFKGRQTHDKRVAWSAPLALGDVKRVGKSLEGTINDILLTAVAGALSRYMQRRGQAIEDVNIRGLIPVNLRPLETAAELGNRFGLVFLSLPLGLLDPLERLHEMKRRMDALKSTPEAAVAMGVLSVMGAVPERLQDVGVQIFDMKGSAVMTNVPGPRQQLYLAGAPIQTVMAWVPQAGRVSLGVSIISYNGQVWLGVTTDRSMVPDPESIVTYFNEEFGQLQEVASQHPSPRRDFDALIASLEEANRSLDEMLEKKKSK